MSRWKVNSLKYGITCGIAAGMAYLTATLRGFSTEMAALEQYRILCDAFTIPGVVLLMLGLLVMIANAGNFLGISYLLVNGLRSLIPFGRKAERYYDYYQRKKAQGKVTGYGFIFISGAIFMAVALVFYALFYMHY